MNLISKDTICAIITPPGNSILGGVRISGEDAEIITRKIFTPNSDSREYVHTRGITHGRVKLLFSIRNSDTVEDIEEMTDAIIYSFASPNSYTCEDVVEIFTAGSPSILQALLRIVTRHGARLAEAGEFTLRAFLNGRLSLGEAESVERIIHAQTDSQRQEAINRLEGGIEKKIASWREELLFISGTIETVIDFEDEDIEEDLEEDLKGRLERLAEEAEKLAKTSSTKHRRTDSSGCRITLAGLTNAGKSSLLNALLSENRAIISSERSTTRDHTEHLLLINEIEFILEDSPGIDIQSSTIADSATERARNRFKASNTLILVIDSSTADHSELDVLVSHLPHCRIIVAFNKEDLSQELDKSPLIDRISKRAVVVDTVTLSALTGTGIDKLRNAIYNEGLSDSSTSSGVGISAREEEELHRASEHALQAIKALELGTEFAAIELRESYDALARLGGEGYAEEILGNVFSRFCIGK